MSENPAENIADKPAADLAENPGAKPAENSGAKSAENPGAEPAENPAENPGANPAESSLAELPGAPVDESATPERPKRRLRLGRIAAVSGAVLLVAAVLGGAGYTVVTVDGADHDPGKPTWRFPKATKATKDKDGNAEATGLAGMLLPYDAPYTRGPDLAEFGTDAELSGRQATALRKESLRDLPRTQRRQLEKEIDKERIKGVVMRSYLSTDAYAAYHKKSFTASVTLSQMVNQRTVRDISTKQIELLDALGIFRKGPKVEGHKNVGCFLPPKDSSEKLDMMVCSAYSGDVLISVTVSGVKPLDGTAVARFLAAQLDRITDPGEAV
ncbi:hypothetical protein ACN6K9_006939 [Streptomyces sp. SAS_267]|uniref:hypothetical protein n=1 Tax=Streptomyces sp. SAS_267 TaxID=3412750 RepID=UPI00403CA9DC